MGTPLRALTALVLATAAAIACGDGGSGAPSGNLPLTDGGGADGAALGEVEVPLHPRAAEMHERADTLAHSMMLHHWAAIRGPSNDAYWTYAQDWDVILDAMERRGPAAYAGTVRMFYEVQDARGWSREYYDDENWMVLALMRAFDLTGDDAYLARARSIFEDIEGAWDETCCGANPGGIWWRQQKDSKVTAINAGAVVSAARLYERTGEASYLAFARKVYDHWAAHMVDPDTGHVYDNVSSTGELNTTWTFTYNEGLMIGAIVALARAEKDASRLPLAHTIAAFMLEHESASTELGTILSDGKCGRPEGDDGEQFKGIAARYLAELYRLDPSHTEYRDFLERSADAIWTLARDPESDRVSCDWAGPYDPDTHGVNSLSSAAMALAATARIMGPAAPRSPLVYHAEEGILRGVGLEAQYEGFSGWGYVAGWGSRDQSVDVLANVEAAGDYALELRYATSPDGARRHVRVNGETLEGNLELPSTGEYTAYSIVRTPSVRLGAGRNTITLTYDEGAGSHGFVNLDSVELVPPAVE